MRQAAATRQIGPVRPKFARTIAADAPIATLRRTAVRGASARKAWLRHRLAVRKALHGKRVPHQTPKDAWRAMDRTRRPASTIDLADTLRAHRRRAGAACRPRAPAAPDFAAADAFVWHPDGTRLVPVPQVNRVDMALLRGIDRVRDILIDNTERFAARPARQQRAAVGRARHGQIVAGQGGACRDQRGARRNGRPAQADRDPSRGHREPARADDAAARRRPHRFIVFCDDLSFDARRHLLQVAEGRARRRHRGPARQRDLLRHLEPPPSDAARHDGERALDRDQSRRGGRGEGLAVGPLRPVARLPPLQPGRISRDGATAMSTHYRHQDRRRGAASARRWNGRRRAARARAASPGSSSRTSRAGSACRRLEERVRPCA